VTGGPNVKVQRRVRAATKRGSAALSLVNMRCQQKSPCFFGSKNMHVANQMTNFDIHVIYMLIACVTGNNIVYTRQSSTLQQVYHGFVMTVCVCVSDLE